MKIQNLKQIDKTLRRKIGYYSTPSFMAEFMVSEMMKLNPKGKKALDPAVGDEVLLIPFQKEDIETVGYDINRYKEEYKCKFHTKDFIKAFIENEDILKNNSFDYIILNPPAVSQKLIKHEIDIKNLQKFFPEAYQNFFAVFLSACIDIAKEGCIIGALVPDSLLYAKGYHTLRQKILKNCSISHIILCPEDTFRKTGANLSACILILQKTSALRDIFVLDRPPTTLSFQKLIKENRWIVKSLYEITLNDEWGNIISPILNSQLKDFMETTPKIGELYKVVGGVSTGNESIFISPERKKGFTYPYFTNSCFKFISEPNSWLRDDFMEFGKARKNFIPRHPEFYNKEGIVCSATGKRFSASYLPFDGIVRTNASIFPPDEDIWWLLAYLNSSFVTFIVKGIISRGNLTTIGNVFSIPLPDFPEKIKENLSQIAKQAVSGNRPEKDVLSQIDSLIETHLKLSRDTISQIHHFCSDLTHLV